MGQRDSRAIKRSVITIVASLAIAGALVLAGASHSHSMQGVSVFAICIALAFLIQWIAFVPSYLAQTEHYYDLTGSVTYLSLLGTAAYLSGPLTTRTLVLCLLVSVWALRLGLFLFRRIAQDGEDVRFREIKTSFLRFLATWTIQGLWVSFTLACALAAITAESNPAFGVLGWIGLTVWVFGFVVEVISDQQKRQFRADPANKGKFIQSGLWAYSRHPNYFGEITLWFGIALIALPALSGSQYLTLISPLFVYLLISRISGVPMLEKSADQRWGDDADYQSYKERTPALFPRFWS